MISDKPSVLAAVVAFRPDRDQLDKVVESASTQARSIVIISNEPWTGPRVEHLPVYQSDENIGLGDAFNFALLLARARECEWLLLLDQDTILPERYIDQLLSSELSANLVAVGGRSVDPRVGRPERKPEEHRWNLNGLVQSSGTLFHVERSIAIEGFDQSLFIHHVDQEFFLRAIGAGLRVVGLGVEFSHEPGRAPQTTGLTGSRAVRAHASDRFYYNARNSLGALRRTELPRSWAVFQTVRSIAVALSQVMFGPSALVGAMRAWFRGARDMGQVRHRRPMDSSSDSYPYRPAGFEHGT